MRALEGDNSSTAAGMDDFSIQQNMTLIQFIEALTKANEQKGAAQSAGLREIVAAIAAQPAPVVNNHITVPERETKIDLRAGDVLVEVPERKVEINNRQGDVLVEMPERETHVHVNRQGATRTVVEKRDKDGNISITRSDPVET